MTPAHYAPRNPTDALQIAILEAGHAHTFISEGAAAYQSSEHGAIQFDPTRSALIIGHEDGGYTVLAIERGALAELIAVITPKGTEP